MQRLVKTVLIPFLLLFSVSSNAQTANQACGSKFFEQLRSIFGQLDQSDLDQAFEDAKPLQCSDLAGNGWKRVAFFNDDRTLGSWSLDSLEKVKLDLTVFVFSGPCRKEQDALKVVTSFPIKETLDKYRAAKKPFAKEIMRANSAQNVTFSRAINAYIFQLPYLYVAKRDSGTVLYSLSPPLVVSRPDPMVAEEFRCKAPKGSDLTYRFILCRTLAVNRNNVQRQYQKPPVGAAAYYILSDGKEAGATVKLQFGPPL